MSASKFTPEIRGGFLERTASGVSLPDACKDLGLRLATVKGWLTRGRREESGDYADFARRMSGARNSAANRTEPMDADELALVVSEQARKGSVQAAKLRWEICGRPRSNRNPCPMSSTSSRPKGQPVATRRLGD